MFACVCAFSAFSKLDTAMDPERAVSIAMQQVAAARTSKDKANLCIACTNAAKAMLAADQEGPEIEALFREGIESARARIARYGLA